MHAFILIFLCFRLIYEHNNYNNNKINYQVVKRAITHSLDKSTEKQVQMSRLLSYLATNEIVSPTQAEKGFQRLEDGLPDLVLDYPNAAKLIADFKQRAVADGVVLIA
jgi:hypothetical protein